MHDSLLDRSNSYKEKDAVVNDSKHIFLTSALVIVFAQAGLALGEPIQGTIPENVFQLPSNIPTEYQDIITKAFPGYKILNPSEVFLDRNVMGPELYNKVKESPGLIVGNFNNDSIADFVVLIRNSTAKKGSWSPEGKFVDRNNNEKYDVYDVNLAVCYGLGGGKFDCTLNPQIFGEIYLPADFALDKTGTEKYVCTSLELHVQAGGMHRYRDDFGKDHGDNDYMSASHMDSNGISHLSVTKFQENLAYDFISKIAYLRCTELPEDVSIPEATSQSSTAIPAEYQAAISKVFPDYQILRPSEISLNKKEMGAELYNKVKASPGLIRGKFNDDNIEDFAALIRNLTKKSYVQTLQGEVTGEFYEAHLAVCYGLGGGKFDCTKIPRAFDEVGLSTDWVLNKTGPGKYFCSSLKEIDLSNDREPFDGEYGEKHNVKLTVKTDVIGYFRTSYAWAGTKYIYQSEDTFLKCIESSD